MSPCLPTPYPQKKCEGRQVASAPISSNKRAHSLASFREKELSRREPGETGPPKEKLQGRVWKYPFTYCGKRNWLKRNEKRFRGLRQESGVSHNFLRIDRIETWITLNPSKSHHNLIDFNHQKHMTHNMQSSNHRAPKSLVDESTSHSAL